MLERQRVGNVFFDIAEGEVNVLRTAKSLESKVIRVTVYLASRENDQNSDRSWVDGCVKCIGLIVCPHFARLFQISVKALGRASREICEEVRSLIVRNGVASCRNGLDKGGMCGMKKIMFLFGSSFLISWIALAGYCPHCGRYEMESQWSKICPRCHKSLKGESSFGVHSSDIRAYEMSDNNTPVFGERKPTRRETLREQVAARQAEADAVRSDLSDAGLPAFGRWIYADSVNSEYRQGAISRTVAERWADYWNSCVARAPKKDVSESAITKWREQHIKWRTFKTLEARRDVVFEDYYNRLDIMVSQVANISAECFRYDIPSENAEVLKTINGMMKPEYYYKWEGLAHQKHGAIGWFDSRFNEIETYLHSRLDKLDGIHKAEFDNWVSQHTQDYLARRSLITKSKELRATKQVAQQQVAIACENNEKLNRIRADAQSARDEMVRMRNEMESTCDEMGREVESMRREMDRQQWELQNTRNELEFQRNCIW